MTPYPSVAWMTEKATVAEKIVIDEVMVQRVIKSSPMWADTPHARGLIRNMLHAALTPPPEPEIPVSAGMTMHGVGAYGARDTVSLTVTEIYRAMERQRLRESAAVPKTEPGALSTRSFCVHKRVGDAAGMPLPKHRRHGDS